MFKVNLAAFYNACGITPPNPESTADEAGVIEVKDGTDFANLCRRSGVPKGTDVTLTFPDVCFIPPPPGGPVPIPYPLAALDGFNAEVRRSGYPKVKVLDVGQPPGNKMTSADGPGIQKGLFSPKNMGKTGFVDSSSNVKAEGKPAIRSTSFWLTSFR